MAFIRSRVDAALAEFLDRKACEAAADGFPTEIIKVLRDFVFAGGKRLRPLLSPTVHRVLAARHAARSDAARFGVNTAILIGDLALAWSDEILHTAGLTSARLAHVLPVIDRMRTEITRGQYLDLLATGRPGPDTDRALDIARYKTAKYTVERPLHIGATLTDAAIARNA
ncbi:polyprenyl synthetase family protein [Streptomyces sp. NPDC051546]|uniref:polyprenyl synthetase family protein n=1 Tax=Streptomyces sp. NPDC051546 TaxID=3365655 RepID=UPI0037ACEDE5